MMSDTTSPSAVISEKQKLSCSLKERLKRCGRYHASPETVARQPILSHANSLQEKVQNDARVTNLQVSPHIKRQCVESSHCKDMACQNTWKSPMLASSKEGKSYRLTGTEPDKLHHLKPEQRGDAIGVEKKLTNTYTLNQTPLSQKSRLQLSNIRGSKLKFGDATDENLQENLKTEEIQCENSENQTLNDTDTCKIDDPKTDSSEAMSRSKLLKELSEKEEQLRKLRMVKMYRSKNNLEELQTLIDKWRDVSQEALQDLHTAMSEPRPCLTELINHLGIDHQLVHFSADDDETFY